MSEKEKSKFSTRLVRIIELISFRIIPIFLIIVSIFYFFYHVQIYMYGGYINFGSWEYHFPIHIWYRGDAFYVFFTSLIANNILLEFAVILIGIGKGIHSTTLIKKFLYFWPLYFFSNVIVCGHIAVGFYSYNSLGFFISFLILQLLYLLLYKILKSKKKYFTPYIKKMFSRVLEINKGIFRLLIIVFSILSVFIGFVTSAESFSSGDEVFVYGLLFTVMYFFLFWFSLWLLLIIANWVIEGFKEGK